MMQMAPVRIPTPVPGVRWFFLEGDGMVSRPWPGANPGFEELNLNIDGNWSTGPFTYRCGGLECSGVAPAFAGTVVPQGFLFHLHSRLTISSWFRLPYDDDFRILSDNALFYCGYQEDAFVVSLPLHGGNIAKVAEQSPGVGWHHLCFVCDLNKALGDKIRMYYDGTRIDLGNNEVGTAPGAGHIENPSGNVRFCEVLSGVTGLCISEVCVFPGWAASDSIVRMLSRFSLRPYWHGTRRLSHGSCVELARCIY